MHFTTDELWRAIDSLVSLPLDEARAALDVGEDGRDWHLQKAVQSLRTMVARGDPVSAITYRPFDTRYTMLNSESGGFIAYPRWDVMGNLLDIEGNLGLVTARLMARGGAWDACLATQYPTEKKTGDSTRSSTLFPLLLGGKAESLDIGESVRVNIAPQILDELRIVCAPAPEGPTADVEARRVVFYLFALLHSWAYRKRYAERLKTEFPRLPLPPTTELWSTLAEIGERLVALYIMESPLLDRSLKSYHGPPAPEVRRVAWSDNVVWLARIFHEAVCIAFWRARM